MRRVASGIRRFGEEGYAEAERVIRQLLQEAGQRDLGSKPTIVDPRPFERPADWKDLRSPENYLGQRRTVGFASPGGIVRHASSLRGSVEDVPQPVGALGQLDRRAGSLGRGGGRSEDRLPVPGRDLNLVMAPETRGNAIRFRVLLDGKPPGGSHGLDVDADGNGTLKDQRMYQLIRQSGPIQDRTFEVEFLDPGAGAFSFTFG